MPERDKRAQAKSSQLEPGLVARVAAGVRYVLNGVTPDDFFGPGQPPVPVAQEQAEGRVMDYPAGRNLQINVQKDSGVTFDQLRALADSYDLLRMVIETRKDQMEALEWNIQGRDPKAQPNQAKLDEITEFFQSPDREHNWSEWLRSVLEEAFVTDALTLYRRRTNGGKLYALTQIDGALIKRVLDENGMTPVAPQPAYQQILKGMPAVNYSTDEMIYRPRNQRVHKVYGYSPVEQIIVTVNIALRRQALLLGFYTEGNMPEALIGVPTDWGADKIERMQAAFDDKVSSNSLARSKMTFVPGGMEVYPVKDAVLKDDFDEWLARIVCYAFSISPQAFSKQMNRATAETAQETALLEGLAPWKAYIKNILDKVIREDFGAPELQFNWREDVQIDPQVQQEVNTGYVKAGIKTINEARAEVGMDGIGPNGDVHFIETATGGITLDDVINPPEPEAEPATVEPDDEVKPGLKLVGKLAKRGNHDLPYTATSPHLIAHAPLPQIRTSTVKAQRKIEKIMTPFLKKAKGQAVAAITGDMEKVIKADVTDVFGDGIEWNELFEPINEVLREFAQQAGAEALVQVEISNKGITNLVNDRAVAWAQNRAAEMVGQRWDGEKLIPNPNAKYAISDTTRDTLRGLVEKAKEEGWSVTKLTNAIKDSGQFTADRAEMIALTEVAMADSASALIAWESSGVVLAKGWLLSSEHDEDDECNLNAEAGPIPLGAPFPTGDITTPQHPRCTCTVVPYT